MSPERMKRAVYVISVAAELAGVHPQTLRIYERKGLVDPARTMGGSRRYSEHDIARLLRIQDLTNAGLNLEGVKRVMELEDEVGRLRAELESARQDGREAVERTHRQYRRDLVPVNNLPAPWARRESFDPDRRRSLTPDRASKSSVRAGDERLARTALEQIAPGADGPDDQAQRVDTAP
jgi:MerR family transcriptional regulator, heat shock protein HspR